MHTWGSSEDGTTQPKTSKILLKNKLYAIKPNVSLNEFQQRKLGK